MRVVDARVDHGDHHVGRAGRNVPGQVGVDVGIAGAFVLADIEQTVLIEAVEPWIVGQLGAAEPRVRLEVGHQRTRG